MVTPTATEVVVQKCDTQKVGTPGSPQRLDDRPALRICLIYDCLFPYTVGGAERWYRNLAERLAADGHQVTYLTLRQWERSARPAISGIGICAIGPRLGLYTRGRRRILPPLIFGVGVLVHLLRYGRAYDVVHTASFPYFSLLAAAVARSIGRYRLVVDWHEVWTLGYWQAYLGQRLGRLGWLIQRLCTKVPQQAFCFSQLHGRRLREEGFCGALTVLRGQYAGDLDTLAVRPEPSEPVVVFAGRHIPEKGVPALVPAIALARRHLPELRGVLFGDGPDRPEVEHLIATLGLGEVVATPGFVDETTLDTALRRALCLVLPSRREGYGQIVVEAAARGTPSIVVASPDSAAAELIEDGVNGVIAPSASAEDLAAAILRVAEVGATLRSSTSSWFHGNRELLSVRSSLGLVTAGYAGQCNLV